MIKADLNTKRAFVAAEDKSGTEIYFPVDSDNIRVLRARKEALVDCLSKQPQPAEEHIKVKEPPITMKQAGDWNRRPEDMDFDPEPPRCA